LTKAPTTFDGPLHRTWQRTSADPVCMPATIGLGRLKALTSPPPWVAYKLPWGDLGRHAAIQPSSAAPHAPAINFFLLNSVFTLDYLRTLGAQSSVSILCPSKTIVTSIVTSLFRQAVTMRGDALRIAAWSLVFLFPTLVLGPHRAGAPSSTVKAETEATIDLRTRGELRELANRVVAASLARPRETATRK